MQGAKRWQIHSENQALSKKIADQLDIQPVVGQLLLNRGIRSIKDAEYFLKPSAKLPQHFPTENLIQMLDVITKCIDSKKPILVYGDYDVDGMTSTAMTISVLRKMGAKVTYFIPNRFKHGYGVNTEVASSLQAYNCGLLITLDCGISNHTELAEIKAACDIDILIFDHHKIPNIIPDVEGILNPQFLDENHPLRTVCTAGLMFAFFTWCESYLNVSLDLIDEADLAAMGSIADVVPMKQYNRYITLMGLSQLTARSRMGIDILLTTAEFDDARVSSRDVGFVIAPRFNAAGRLGSAGLGVDMLLCEDTEQATKLAHTLCKMNLDRREIGAWILDEALKQLKLSPELARHKVIVLSGHNWHAGVVGIIASKLAEQYSRPVVMISAENAIARASCRTIGSVSIYDLLKPFDTFFESFGGHSQAAGFSIRPSKIKEFSEALRLHADAVIEDKDLYPIIELDCELPASLLSLDFISDLRQLEPFGPENPSPIFYTKSLKAIDFKLVGKDRQHIKATFQDKNSNCVIDGIGFGMKTQLPLLYEDSILIAFELNANTFNGRTRAQLQLIDIKQG